MRTITDAQDAALKSQYPGVTARVRIKDGTGTFRDYSDLNGINWISSVQWGESVDRPVMDAQVKLRRRFHNLNLSPLMDDAATLPFADYIQTGREIEIDVAVMPMGQAPGGSDWINIFVGTVDKAPISGDFIDVQAREAIGARLANTQIEDEISYSDLTTPEAVQSVIQEILDDWITSPTVPLFTPVDPLWDIFAFTQRKERVLPAIRQLASQIGWDLRVVWDNGTNAFRLTLFEPDRAKVAPDRTFNAADYTLLTNVDLGGIDTIRNVIKVWYDARTGPTAENNADGTPVRKSVIAEDAGSIAAVGRLYMEVGEAGTSNIDSSVEAQRMADALLADLSTPDLTQRSANKFFWPVQLGDLYRFEANGEHYSSDQDLAVYEYRHQIDGNRSMTELLCRGKPRAANNAWFDYEVAAGSAMPKRETGPLQINTLAPLEFANGSMLALPRAEDHTWDGFEIHRATVNGFTPTAATFVGYVRGNKFVDREPLFETTNYYKVFAVDRDGNKSPVSNQVSTGGRGIKRVDFATVIRESFEVELSADQVIPTTVDTITTVEFDQFIHPPSGGTTRAGFNSSTHQWECPATGVYAVLLKVVRGDSTKIVQFRATLRLNGADNFANGNWVLDLIVSAPTTNTSQYLGILALNAGDKLDPRVQTVIDTPPTQSFTVDADSSRFAIAPLPSNSGRT